MSSNENRKRQQDEVVQFPIPSDRANKRQLKLPPKQIDSINARVLPRPTLLDLPAGVVANVGKFMDTRARAADLMAMCVVFGSDVAKVVRKSYLENNLDYLGEISDAAYSVAMVAANKCFDKRLSFEKKALYTKAFRNDLATIKVKLEEWMSENEWWKGAALLGPAYHHHRDNADAGLPVIFKTFELKAFATEEEKMKFQDETIAISTSGHVDLYDYQSSSDDDPVDEVYSTVLSVNGTLGTSFDHVKELLLEEGSNKTLKMIHHAFTEIFFNPAVMIDLGLLDVLRFQMEEMKLDVNYQKFSGIHFRGRENDGRFQEGMPLILHSLVQPDERIFQYILSLKSIEAIPELERDLHGNVAQDDYGEGGHTLLHELARFTTYPLIGNDIDLIQRLRLMLEKGKYDVNAHDFMRISPLEYLCFRTKYGRRQFDLARLFLSFGADVSEQAVSSLNRANKTRTNEKDDRTATSNSDVGGYGTNIYHAGDMLALLTTTQKMRDAEGSNRDHS